MDKVTFESQRIPHIRLFHVRLVYEEVLMQCLEIEQHLHSAIHVARVA